MTTADRLQLLHLALAVIRGADLLLGKLDELGIDETALTPEDLADLRERRRAAAERTRRLTPVPGPGSVAGE